MFELFAWLLYLAGFCIICVFVFGLLMWIVMAIIDFVQLLLFCLCGNLGHNRKDSR